MWLTNAILGFILFIKCFYNSKNTYFALSIFPFSKNVAYTSIAAATRNRWEGGLVVYVAKWSMKPQRDKLT